MTDLGFDPDRAERILMGIKLGDDLSLYFDYILRGLRQTNSRLVEWVTLVFDVYRQNPHILFKLYEISKISPGDDWNPRELAEIISQMPMHRSSMIPGKAVIDKDDQGNRTYYWRGSIPQIWLTTFPKFRGLRLDDFKGIDAMIPPIHRMAFLHGSIILSPYGTYELKFKPNTWIKDKIICFPPRNYHQHDSISKRYSEKLDFNIDNAQKILDSGISSSILDAYKYYLTEFCRSFLCDWISKVIDVFIAHPHFFRWSLDVLTGRYENFQEMLDLMPAFLGIGGEDTWIMLPLNSPDSITTELPIITYLEESWMPKMENHHAVKTIIYEQKAIFYQGYVILPPGKLKRRENGIYRYKQKRQITSVPSTIPTPLFNPLTIPLVVPQVTPTIVNEPLPVNPLPQTILYTECSEPFDLITQEEWSEQPPNFFIRFIDPGNKMRLKCYRKENLQRWLNDRENTFALWVQRSPDRPMTDTGLAGRPDHKNLYYKLYTQEYVENDPDLQLHLLHPFIIIYDAVARGIKRIGNLAGIFASSGLHGQEPGYQTYKLQQPHFLAFEPELSKYTLLDYSAMDIVERLIAYPEISLEEKAGLAMLIPADAAIDPVLMTKLYQRDIDAIGRHGNYVDIMKYVLLNLADISKMIEFASDLHLNQLLKVLLQRPEYVAEVAGHP